MSPPGHVKMILPATRPASLGEWGNRCLLSLNGQCFENSLVLCAVLWIRIRISSGPELTAKKICIDFANFSSNW
jgi:hypothetical protein